MSNRVELVLVKVLELVWGWIGGWAR